MWMVALITFGIFAYMKTNGKEPISNWSWWWVTSPLWIYTILLVFLVAVVGAFGVAIFSGT